VIATGEQLSVRDFLVMSAKALGIILRFEGEGIQEVGIVDRIEVQDAPHIKVGDVIVKIDPRYFRPTEVETLLGDISLAHKNLGWAPQIKIDELCHEMIAHDLDEARQLALLKGHGYKIKLNFDT
jgi:GDPmannose 4,6-dehydratase